MHTPCVRCALCAGDSGVSRRSRASAAVLRSRKGRRAGDPPADRPQRGLAILTADSPLELACVGAAAREVDVEALDPAAAAAAARDHAGVRKRHF